ncbi:MAG: hypothetical protein O7F69_08120 [Alphaproteobacteria bacterium]|nr:hypothetical protein [Alphaproteobacteria bacterium]MCZ6863049.1 hypothetical protein [Alphaproteobacteria bacterium]
MYDAMEERRKIAVRLILDWVETARPAIENKPSVDFFHSWSILPFRMI